MKILRKLFGKDNVKIDASEIWVANGLLLPDTVIVESGNNINGKYTRFGNGLQICTSTLTLKYIRSDCLEATWDYPISFSNSQAIVHANTSTFIPDTGSGYKFAFAYISPTTSTILIRYYRDANTFTSSSTMNIRCRAIGDWK